MVIDRRRTSGAACLLVLLAGCKGCKDDATLPELLEAEDATPVGVWVGEGLGASPVRVPVYATSALGAAVPTDTIALTSEGTAPAAVTPGGDGWALVEVTAENPGRYGLSASSAGASAEGAAWAMPEAPGRIDAFAAPLSADPTAIARAAGGVAWSTAGEVWWSGWDGAPATRALALDEPVIALLSAEIDADGVTDLVVLSATRVVLLRGRDAGGLTWGAGWSATEDRTIAGAVIADRDGDSVADLSIALAGSEGAWIYQLDGDGVWGFTPADALELGYAVYGLSVEDLDENGVSEVTVLTEDGFLRRYTRVDGEWASTLSGSQFDLQIGQGGHLWPATDVTGDDIPEFIVTGPSLDGTSWLAWVVTAGMAEPAQYAIASAEGLHPWLGAALGDLTGDGVIDIGLTSPGRFTWAVWNGTTFLLTTRRDLPSGPTLELDDVDSDGIVDAVLGGTTLRVLHGDREVDDPADPKDIPAPWIVRTPTPLVFGVHLVLEPAVQDVNGDPIVDVVGLVLPSGGTSGVAIQGFVGVPRTETTAETLRSGGAVTLTGSGSALALAVCGTRAYALYEEADGSGVLGTWLARANLGAGLGPTLDGDPVAVDGSLLACGAFADGEVAVADPTGAVDYVGADGTVMPGESLGPIGGISAGDPDGDGVDTLSTCAVEGCVTGAADLDGDGLLDTAVQNAESIAVVFGDGTSDLLVAPGTLRLDDADGDSVADLVVGSAGAAWVVRAVPGGLTPPVASWTVRPVADAVRYGDLDGDGLPDAFFFGVDPDETDADATWAGTLLYARTTE